MSAPVVLLDACVLYQAALRDLLMRLAVRGFIYAKWSAQIHEEWIAITAWCSPTGTREERFGLFK